MNKTELAAAVAAKTGQSASESAAAVAAVVEVITEQMVAGNEVNIAGFGKFSVGERAAREGRNPKTGETIQIAASKSAKFKSLKALKDALNG